eukprot:TRINITY_DN1404_c0_g2_i14.p1 TRINITY_DN1404_c0_g2~~TRINITY_DN1404_c0_g2_i14.p1  ORF type:complete len:105 (-),score=22.16 TRINITY_DN1404_c0_g2_i14:10-324(-)
MDRLGKENKDGKKVCDFGTFFLDPVTEQTFESLVGSLKAARKRGLIDFKGQMLLYPVNKDVQITLLKPYDPKDYPKYAKEHAEKEIGRAVQQECRDRSRMPSSA